MTATKDYTATIRGAENFYTSTLESWKTGFDSLADRFRAVPTVNLFPQFDATEVVERQFALIKQVVDLNHDYARSLAEVANTLTGVTRQQMETWGSTVRDQVQSVSEAARDNVDTVEQRVRDQAERAEQAEADARRAREEAERQQARDAAKADRQQRKAAHDKARERYESLTKTELADEAAKRGLPKTGTVDELVERLVEDDTEHVSK